MSISLKEVFSRRAKRMSDYDLDIERLQHSDQIAMSEDTRLWVITVAVEQRKRTDRKKITYPDSKVFSLSNQAATEPHCTVVMSGDTD